MARPPIPSGFICYHCGSDKTSKGGWSKGKQRFKCRGCGKFFIDPAERVVRPRKQTSTAPDTSPEVRKVNPYSRKGINRKKRPSAGHLILKLRAIAQTMGKTPTTAEITQLAKQGRSYQLQDYYDVFGGYLAALKRGRLKPRYKQEFDEYDRERMLGELRRVMQKLKRPIFNADVVAARRRKEVSPPFHFARAFGSVPVAIEAAGAGKKIYSREEIIKFLRKLDAKLDRPIQTLDIKKYFDAKSGPSFNAITKEFGTLSRARRVAGTQKVYLKARKRTTYWQKYTKEKLIAQLKALGKKLGRKPVYKDIMAESNKRTGASTSTFSVMFGNLAAAYRAAGYSEIAPTARSWTDEEIVAAIKKLTKELGRFPGFHDLEAASFAGKCPSPGTVVRRMGKLTELRVSAGFDIAKTSVRYTDDEIIAALKRFSIELGRFPNYPDLVAGSRAGKCPSPSVVRRIGKLAEIRSRLN